jgi:hypothetical protein
VGSKKLHQRKKKHITKQKVFEEFSYKNDSVTDIFIAVFCKQNINCYYALPGKENKKASFHLHCTRNCDVTAQ